MLFHQFSKLVFFVSAFAIQSQMFAQNSRTLPANAQSCLDEFFLNCDAVTANSCELASGSITKTNGTDIHSLDFVWFRAQKTAARRKDHSFIDGRSYDPRHGPASSFWERKLIVGEEGFYGLGPNPPLEPLDLNSRIPGNELEAYLERQKRLSFSQNRFPEICPATVLAAVNANPQEGTLGKTHALFARMTLIDEYTKESLLVGTWRIDGKDSPARACVKIRFDKKQGYMPTYVEWRLRDKEAKSDPNNPASFAKIFNQGESKWSQINKSKNIWVPVRVVNKSVGPAGQEWFIEATWKVDALKDEYFDAGKINADRDENPLAKLRRLMQNAADKEKADKADKAEKPASGEKAGK
ncbi:MAG: hypothetical protein ACKVP0_20780 [Pirellulaceae bacterium]